MKEKITAGDWECFHGSRDIETEGGIPTIICRPTTDSIMKVPYFEFFENRVFLHKPKEIMEIHQEKEYDRILFSLKK